MWAVTVAVPSPGHETEREVVPLPLTYGNVSRRGLSPRPIAAISPAKYSAMSSMSPETAFIITLAVFRSTSIW